MTVAQIPNGKQQFLDGNGSPLAGGSVQFYIPATTTAKDTWQDSAGTMLNPNPVPLDANGEAVIWGTGSYRQIVADANGVTIWDQVVTAPATDTLFGSGPVIFASLPNPFVGARAMITDSPTAAAGNFAAHITVGGGANVVPVWSPDGSNWYIG